MMEHVQHRDIGRQYYVDSVWRTQTFHDLDPENVRVPFEWHEKKIVWFRSEPVHFDAGTGQGWVELQLYHVNCDGPWSAVLQLQCETR